jgi:predicted nucleic acid-binding protein
MPEVIADTSVIQYLYQCDCFFVLLALYEVVTIPSAVADELEKGREIGVALPKLADYGWLQVLRTQLQRLVPQIAGLGQGEREVISVAISSPKALALLDDGLARQYTKSLGVSVTGTLGILLKAKRSQLIDRVAPVMDRLNQLGFRASGATQLAVLKLAGEVAQ